MTALLLLERDPERRGERLGSPHIPRDPQGREHPVSLGEAGEGGSGIAPRGGELGKVQVGGDELAA